MSVTIRKMTKAEFEIFYRWSVEQYARELMEELQICQEEAVSKANEEVAQMLPDGFHTARNNFMTVVAERESVGFLWTVYEETEGRRQCFLCDFAIWEPQRRYGYGEAALKLLAENAAAAGRQEIVLFVRDENTAAKALYEKCGYRLLRQAGYGAYMAKQLV